RQTIRKRHGWSKGERRSCGHRDEPGRPASAAVHGAAAARQHHRGDGVECAAGSVAAAMNALAVDEMTSLPLPTMLPEPARPLWFERFIDLAALPTALLCARLFVASTLQRWGARFLEADAELLAVELVRHSVATCGVIDEGVRLAELEDVT